MCSSEPTCPACTFYGRVGKRAIDIAVSGIGLVVLLPVLGAVAAGTRFAFSASPLFRQKRTGLHGRHFLIYKFRTMTNACDESGNPLPDEQRLTSFGRFLRRFSLDELPQLVNVLKGEMSLIGPRPLLARYDDWYSDVERNRFLVRPGITGHAQTRGRNHLAWRDRLALDVEYVRRFKFSQDVRIALATVGAILRRNGSGADVENMLMALDEERRLTMSGGADVGSTPPDVLV